MNRAPHRLVDGFEGRLEPLETEFHRAYWESQVRATPENDRRRADLELQLRALKGDASMLSSVNQALAEGMHEPALRRQLEVLRLSLTANQMTDAQREEMVELASGIESDFATFRPDLDGEALTENKIVEILERSDDVEHRHRTWLASKQIGQRVAGRVRELTRLRNHVALEQGYADYYRMALDLQEISEEWLFGLFDRLDELTRGPFLEWKGGVDRSLADRFGTRDLRPWHYADPFFQHPPRGAGIDLDPFFQKVSAVDLAAGTFREWGFDLGPVLEASDLFPRADKCQHAFCIDVDRSGRDVRILANIVPGERWVETMLHESGHAAYDISIDRHLPYLLRRPAHTFVTEAIAILAGRLTRDPEWLVRVARVSDDDVAPRAAELRRSSAIQSILFARWVLVMAHFERDLYSDPEADLDQRWWELVERYQDVRNPGQEVRGAWAAKIHIAAAPVYYHNYLLGELLASQLEETLSERAGGVVGSETAGKLLNDGLFRHGNKLRWDKVIEEATGRPLSAEPFAQQVRSTSPSG
ncbi:MAG TPA: M2 family metallopeptidase [Actinomycetota bacterium]|nr:M2 family metallopeptidase [Actinomycetota bacterium]